MTGKPRTLFPISSVTESPDSTPEVPSLFPSVSIPLDNSTTPQASWLQNSSFPEHLVDKLNSVNGAQTRPQVCQPVVSVTEKQKYDSKRRKTDKESKKDKKKKSKKHKRERSSKEDSLKFELFELLYKGDKKNVTYGSLYSYDVPTYKTYIKYCLGDIVSSTLSQRAVNNHDTSSRYFTRVKAPELSLHHRSKFLRLDADYISLTVSSQCWEPCEPVLAALDPSKSDPGSREKWLLFIESTGRTKAGLERRYDICQKARKFLPHDLGILKKTIETARQYMTSEEIGRVWTDLLFHHPNRIELWEEYLSYKESDLTQLSFSSVLAAYRKCFATLFGFHRGTFRSHTFEGDIEDSLIRIAARLLKLLLNMGYSERAYSLQISLLELSTSSHTKSQYLSWWDGNLALLGTVEYIEWWRNNAVTCNTTETISQIRKVEDIWSSWLQEELRKEELCFGPVSRRMVDSSCLVDGECCVTRSWLDSFLFTSTKPEQLFETLFRCYLPDHLNELPLLVLFHCDIDIDMKVAEFLTRVTAQLYPRFKDQSSIGVVWTLLTHITTSNNKSTAKFVKNLLKDTSHRNNMVYWSLYLHFSNDNRAIIPKLLSTPLSPYHRSFLEKELARCQHPDSGSEDADMIKRRIEEQICKPVTSCSETLHLGTHATLLFCKTPDSSGLEEFVTALCARDSTPEQNLTDLFILLRYVLSREVMRKESAATGGDGGDSSIVRKIAVLAVEQFPQVTWFWNVLADNITLTAKIWDRLLKCGGSEAHWWRRVSVECDKQRNNPDINLGNRILSIASNATDAFPQSDLLWRQYITVTKEHDPGSLKSVLIRCIKENPARKENYLKAIQLCPEEAETVYELIEEKEIRLRTLIEEIQMISMGI